MICPNKSISYEESIVGKIVHILKLSQYKRIPVIDLYEKCSLTFDDINEFIYALDVLFVLDSISFDVDKGVIVYAEANSK